MFRDKLEEALYTINRKNNNCILMGDFNIDISSEDTTKHDFINTLHLLSLFPMINMFTRIRHLSKSTIDNMITNIHNPTLEFGVVLSDITDDFPIALFVNLFHKVVLTPGKITMKVLNNSTLRQLCENLETKSWNSVYNDISESIISLSLKKLLQVKLISKIPGFLKGFKFQKNKLYKEYIKKTKIKRNTMLPKISSLT